MFAATAYCFRNLTNIHGRDGRDVFCRYLLFVTLLNIVISLLWVIPMFVSAWGAGAAAVQIGNSAEVEAAILEEVIRYAPIAVWVGLALAALNIFLVAAAFVRRSHDTGLPGFLLLIPLTIHVIWMGISYNHSSNVDKTMRAVLDTELSGSHSIDASVQIGMVAQDLLGWLAFLIILIVGFMKPQHGKNAYGEGRENGNPLKNLHKSDDKD